jgi:hypothetical protein
VLSKFREKQTKNCPRVIKDLRALTLLSAAIFLGPRLGGVPARGCPQCPTRAILGWLKVLT